MMTIEAYVSLKHVVFQDQGNVDRRIAKFMKTGNGRGQIIIDIIIAKICEFCVSAAFLVTK